jgi:hypothetical protein
MRHTYARGLQAYMRKTSAELLNDDTHEDEPTHAHEPAGTIDASELLG